MNPNVSSYVKAFADAFGSEVAYIGWTWTMGARGEQYYTDQLLEQLKYNKSTEIARMLEQACQEVRKGHNDPKADIHLMRIYGQKDNIIDVRAKGYEQ